jgi:hypothetical protein
MFQIKEADFVECWKLHNCIPEFAKRDLDSFKHRLKGHKFIALVAYADYVAQGFMLSYDLSETNCYLWLAGSLPNSRKHGYMQQLLNQLEIICLKQGYTKLTVKSMNQFRPMLNFLLKNNFDIIDVGEDSKILFQKNLL